VGKNPHTGQNVYVLSPLGLRPVDAAVAERAANEGISYDEALLKIKADDEANLRAELNAELYAGNQQQAVELMLDAGRALIPNPKDSYDLARLECSIAFDPNQTIVNRVCGGVGFLAAGVLAVTDVVPGKSTVQRPFVRGAIARAERIAERVGLKGAKAEIGRELHGAASCILDDPVLGTITKGPAPKNVVGQFERATKVLDPEFEFAGELKEAAKIYRLSGRTADGAYSALEDTAYLTRAGMKNPVVIFDEASHAVLNARKGLTEATQHTYMYRKAYEDIATRYRFIEFVKSVVPDSTLRRSYYRSFLTIVKQVTR
jgi:hypothetical protein